MIGFDIMRNSDLHVVDFKVASVRIDGVDFPASSPDGFNYRLGRDELDEWLRAVARGKQLQVFAEGRDDPVVNLRIGNGKRVAAFLRKCS